MVPKAAIVKAGSSDYVFVVKGGRVEQRVVRLGDEVGEFYVVLDGLSGGESTATTGADKLKDGDRVQVVGG
jgi:multidrug efflux system membrane fusion protein